MRALGMWFAQLLWTSLTIASGPAAQDPAKLQYEIRGTVVEPGSGTPVTGATVTVLRGPGKGPVALSEAERPLRQAESDSSGHFQVTLEEAGPYVVEARHPDYSAPPAQSGFPPNLARVRLSETKPRGEVRFLLARPARLLGTVVDEEEGQPLASLEVEALRQMSHVGRNLYLPEARAHTAADGRFVIPGLPPGAYIVSIHPAAPRHEQVTSRFTREDRLLVEHSYPTTYGPGRGDIDEALPVQLISGGEASTGTLRLKKQPHYRVWLDFQGWRCRAGTSVQIRRRDGRDFPVLGRADCGAAALVTGLPPGPTQLVLLPDGYYENSGVAALVEARVPIEEDKIVVPFQPVVRVAGRLSLPGDGKRPDWTKLHLWLDGGLSIGGGKNTGPDAEGAFELMSLPMKQSLRLAGLPEAYAVKAIRYNGTPLPDQTLPLDELATEHRLEIELTERPGAISGLIANHTEQTEPAFVALIRLPLRRGDPFAIRIAEAQADGTFHWGGLEAGPYCVVALRAEARWKLDSPDHLPLLSEQGKAVTVSFGTDTSVRLAIMEH